MSVNAVTKIVGRSFINFGQYLNVLGGKLNPEVDRLQRSRRVNPFLGSQPTVQNPLFLAPSAAVYGNVTIDPGCTVWYNSVIRAEKGPVAIGSNSHIQERAVISSSLLTEGQGVTIGSNVVIESGATVGPSTIADGAYICSGAVITEGSSIPKGAVIGSGVVVGPEQSLAEDTYYSAGEEPRAVSAEERTALGNKLKAIAAQASTHEFVNTIPVEKVVELDMIEAKAQKILSMRYIDRPNLVVRSPVDLPGGRKQTMAG